MAQRCYIMAIKSNKSVTSDFEINFDGAKWKTNAELVGQKLNIYHVFKCKTKYGKKWCAVLTNKEESAKEPVLLIIPNVNQENFENEIANADIENEINGCLSCDLTMRDSKNGNKYYKLEW